MTESYNSFKDLVSDFPKVSEWLENHQEYWAHTPKIRGQSPEILMEHIDKVNNYALLVSKIHHLDFIVDNIINKILAEQKDFSNQKALGIYMKNLFIRSILFHDYGKVNPNFQVLRMGNHFKFKEDKSIKISYYHSSLSAYAFLHFHIQETLELNYFNSEERKFLWVLVFLFASPIFKHHSKFLDFKELPFSEDEYENLKGFLDIFKIKRKIPLDNLFKVKALEDIFAQFEKKYDKDVLFSVFTLLKLSFSLLTASDYYATFDYTSGNSTAKLILKEQDFGLIEGNFRNKIIQNFKTTKNYNQALFEKTEKLKNMPFADLQDQSKENLNHLRQKLAAEALTNIRAFPNDNLFYLEAPTGAGKTNVSLASAIELLKKNQKLNKIFYVFPFTTLVTQTFEAIKETLEINNEHIIQLHSKSGFHQANEEVNDGNYGEYRINFINNHFVNYPITLLTHIKFFDILKGNSKENNYIFHRLANSIVIIDELQTYNPKHWDKTIYFLSKYAKLFNIKIILMSATLPKIGRLLVDQNLAKEIKYLISKENKPLYFRNKNFAGRVEFDFSMLDKWNWKRPVGDEARNRYLEELVQKVYEESEMYARSLSHKPETVRTLIEFITKKSASRFFRKLQENDKFRDYKLYLVSGEILDPRRGQIIKAIKDNKDSKVILVTTQVVEAGVDIDMDLGFKDRSLIDSDEQLAGRVNRNASKNHCKIFMFDYDREAFVYRNDPRLRIDDPKKRDTYKSILQTKDFDSNFYNLVQDKITKDNQNEAMDNLSEYLQAFKRFNFKAINQGFQLIEQDSESVFVPLPIPKEDFSEEDLKTIKNFNISEYIEEDKVYISGKDVWQKYVDIVTEAQDKKKDYFDKQTQLKQIYGLLSKFMFSVFSQQADSLKEFTDYNEEQSTYKQFGVYFLSKWKEIYRYKNGLDTNKVKKGHIFL